MKRKIEEVPVDLRLGNLKVYDRDPSEEEEWSITWPEFACGMMALALLIVLLTVAAGAWPCFFTFNGCPDFKPASSFKVCDYDCQAHNQIVPDAIANPDSHNKFVPHYVCFYKKNTSVTHYMSTHLTRDLCFANGGNPILVKSSYEEMLLYDYQILEWR